MYYNLPKTNNFFLNHKNQKIHYREWLTNSSNFIFYIHGYNCNINRNITQEFTKLIPKINFCSYDIAGHGFSEGETALVTSQNDLIQEALQFIQLMLKKHNVQKYIIMGSSMGGSITIETLKNINDNKCIGAILLAPAISLCNNNNQLLEYFLKNYLSHYLPNQKFPEFLNYRVNTNISINCKKLCHWTQNEDELTYKNNIKFQTANTIISLGYSNLQNLHKIKHKITILHDINDPITSFQSSAKFSSLTKSKLIPLNNLKHDLLANCPNLISQICIKIFNL
jgi:alpha-beta hydrolase superfamily lysophospholipase